MSRVLTFGMFGLMGIALGCQDANKDKGEDAPEVMDGPTFYQDVLPIVGENCQSCHNEAAPMGAAFPLESYAHVAPLAELLFAKMLPEGDPDNDPYYMPPFYARDSEECATYLGWKGTYQAGGTELEIFEAWLDAGKQEGDPDTPAAFTPRTIERLEGEDMLELSYRGAYEVPAPNPESEVYDLFRCFAVQTLDADQPWLTEDVFIDGFEFTPGNSKVAHHMLAYGVPNMKDYIAGGLIEDTDTNSWECAGGPSRADGSAPMPDASIIYGWVPGSQPLTLEDNTAIRVTAGTGIVVQLHYNTLSIAEDEDRTDISTLRMRRTDTAENEARIRLFGVANPNDSDAVEDPPFLVPYGVSGHVESYAEILPDTMDDADVRIWGVVPHMHLAGTGIKLTRTRDSGEEDCLAHVPRWDFNWQQFYVYEGSFSDWPRLMGGDTLRLTCTLDNTDDNPFLQEYLGGGISEGISLGESTSEEMCLIALGIACDGACPDGI